MKKLILLIFVLLHEGSHLNAQGGLLKKLKGDSKSPTIRPEDNGITSDFHEKHLKEIVFSIQPTKNNGIINNNVTKINFGDSLYACAFLEKSIFNSLLDKLPTEKSMDIYLNSELIYNCYIDGVLVNRFHQGKMYHPMDRLQKTTRFDFEYYDGTIYPENFPVWKNLIRKGDSLLTIGDHKIKLEMIVCINDGAGNLTETQPIASGEIILTIKNKQLVMYEPTYCLPRPKDKNVIVETSMLEAFKNKGFGEPIKAIIIGTYNLKEDEFGKLVSRTFYGSIVYNNGADCGYSNITFKQYFNQVAGTYGSCEIEEASKLKFNAINIDCLKQSKE